MNQNYQDWLPAERADRIVAVEGILKETIDPNQIALLGLELGNLLYAERQYEQAINDGVEC
jgi:hypothetical protein